MYSLNTDKAERVIMCNDTFCYFTNDEEPLDDASWDEINALLEAWPNGFELRDPLLAGSQPGHLDVLLVPYTQDTFRYDAYQWLGTAVRLELVRNSDGTVDVWQWSSTRQERVLLRSQAPILTNKYGGQYIETGEPEGWRHGTGCMWPMKHFQKVIM